MNERPIVPSLAIVRIATPGGPYLPGHRVSLAFVDAAVARLVSHEILPSEHRTEDAIVPESVSAVVTAAAGPYAEGDSLTLSFVDPSIARVHPVLYPADPGTPNRRATDGFGGPPQILASTPVVSEAPDPTSSLRLVHASSVVLPAAAEPPPRPAEFVLRLPWPEARASRFVQVVDKLFTVDRLGWYRHVLAMRLLVAEDIVPGFEDAVETGIAASASSTLRIVRNAGLEALGAPLLAAYLPSFTVTPDWLGTIESPALAESLARLDDDLTDASHECANPADGMLGKPETLVSPLALAAFVARRGANPDTRLPWLVPTVSVDGTLSAALAQYRETLIELFSQIAPAAPAVRVRQMAQPNALLDDRLWQVAGAVHQSLASPEAATGA